MKIRQILKSWDIWLALICTVVVVVLLPVCISADFAKDMYFMGLSVLAIVFSIFFASLAVIMSSSHDDFVSFLEEKKQYTAIVSSFTYTLVLLFAALLLSIVLYVYTSYSISQADKDQTKWLFVGFAFLALYALFAVVMSTRDTISYSQYRARFLEIKRRKQKDEDGAN